MCNTVTESEQCKSSQVGRTKIRQSKRMRTCRTPRGGGGAPPLWKVIGTCRWTGYDFAGHQYWHRVSNRPNVVITIGTGYQIGLMWSSPLTQGIKIGLLGYGRLLRLSQDRMPIVFYDRPAIQAEAMTFFFFFFACQLSIPNQTGYIRGVQYCNRVCI